MRGRCLISSFVFLALATTASAAFACGGLFCNSQAPVNQAAERIIFADRPDGTVTAVVQIMYQGPSEKFAWVLPVPTVPEVELSSDLAFQRLQSVTNPRYTMNVTVEGTCVGGRISQNGDAVLAESSGDGGGAGSVGGEAGVEVLAEGEAGPYDWVAIEVTGNPERPVDVALDWLDTEGYDVGALAPDLLAEYLADGMKLLAFKLRKTAATGDIRPIRINYEADIPMIPIKLTAVAANDDMGVLVWVLGPHRAIPTNYRALELNDTLINWFSPGQNYAGVINRAADEAGGRGFVTEYAGTPIVARDVIFTRFDRDRWEQLRGADWTGRIEDFLQQMANTYRSWDGWPTAVDAAFPRLAADARDRIVECGGCAFLDSDHELPDDFEPQDLIDAVRDFVIDPMRQTQDLIEDHEYMTRLYTTMSASEMREDPCFDFNADLPDHSNVHTAEQTVECGNEAYTFNEAPWRVELPSGFVVRGQGRQWPFDPADDEEMPANLGISDMTTSGDGELVVDNAPEIRRILDTHNASISGPGCSCSTSGATRSGAAGAAALLLLALVARRRRR